MGPSLAWRQRARRARSSGRWCPEMLRRGPAWLLGQGKRGRAGWGPQDRKDAGRGQAWGPGQSSVVLRE